jgi:ABC-type sugar transport system ATPase subunit
MKPQVLIIDEALSVGDVFFQQKSFAKMREIILSGTTCIFVSHDVDAIRNLCDEAILLSHGEIKFMGTPEEAVSRYYSKRDNRTSANKKVAAEMSIESNEDELIHSAEIFEHNILNSKSKRHGAGRLQIVAVRIIDSYGSDTMNVQMLEVLKFYVLLRANETIYHPCTGIHLFDRFGNLVYAANSSQLKYKLPSLKSGQELVIKTELIFSVQPGEYTFSLGVAELSEGGEPNDPNYLQDRHESLGPIVVTTDNSKTLPFYGLTKLPMSVTFHSVK